MANGNVWIGTDNNLLVARQGIGQLRTLAAVGAGYGGDDAGRALEVEERLLELRIDHGAVRHDDHGVEDFPVVVVVQFGQEVRGPCPWQRLC